MSPRPAGSAKPAGSSPFIQAMTKNTPPIRYVCIAISAGRLSWASPRNSRHPKRASAANTSSGSVTAAASMSGGFPAPPRAAPDTPSQRAAKNQTTSSGSVRLKPEPRSPPSTFEV